MNKIDARKLGAEGRETLRKRVIRLRTQSGMKAAELAAVAGVHVRTVEGWLRKPVWQASALWWRRPAGASPACAGR